uniref:Putative ovule protein n=1 Tax=Solanum chacoense TaxID=4108 RepID=A0A0V0I312_SOLCH
MDQINLHQSSSQHETENQATSERHDADFDEKYVELKKEIAEVRMELKELKDNVDKHMTDMKAYVDNSTNLIIEEIRSSRGQPSQATHQQDDAYQHVEESEKAPMDQPSVSMREYVHTSNTDDEAQKSNDQTIGVVFNADIPGSSNTKPPTLDDYPDFTMTQIVALDPILNANTTPDVQPRNRNPGKYDTSPYIRLSEGESSSRRVPILFRIKHPFESHNGFEVSTELIDEFNKWVFKDVSSRRGRKSAYSKLKDSFEPQMDFGVVKVAEKDFFNIMVKPGRPWEDGHVNTIMYYLRKKAKYSPIPLSYSTVDCWFMTWVDNIEKQWRESNCDMRSISPDHDVGQCIRGFKLLANIPWDKVDNVIIPVNISEKFHWFLVVFRIKLRCLHVYDSMKGGAVHTKKVNRSSW